MPKQAVAHALACRRGLQPTVRPYRAEVFSTLSRNPHASFGFAVCVQGRTGLLACPSLKARYARGQAGRPVLPVSDTDDEPPGSPALKHAPQRQAGKPAPRTSETKAGRKLNDPGTPRRRVLAEPRIDLPARRIETRRRIEG